MRIPITRASPSFSLIDSTSYIPCVRDAQSRPDDLGVAVAAVQAAAHAAQQARSRPLNPRAKSVAADLVTEADAVAERAAAHMLGQLRPDDAILGEEGTSTQGTGRRWLIDGIDGTVAFAGGLPGWCSAVALEDEQGAAVAAVLDAGSGELHTARRGEARHTI